MQNTTCAVVPPTSPRIDIHQNHSTTCQNKGAEAKGGVAKEASGTQRQSNHT